jgi:hypothetical protein
MKSAATFFSSAYPSFLREGLRHAKSRCRREPGDEVLRTDTTMTNFAALLEEASRNVFIIFSDYLSASSVLLIHRGLAISICFLFS